MPPIIVNNPVDGRKAKINVPDGVDPNTIDISSLFGKAKEFVSNIGKSVSNNGLNLIKQAEKFSPKPYMDTNGKLSIGYGTQLPDTQEDDEISESAADGILNDHIHSEVLPWIHKNVKQDLNQNQMDAVASLIYNIGASRFAESRAYKALNEGDFDTFKREAFSRDRGFVKANGRTLAGLVGRRNNERRLFDGELTST